MTPSDCEHQFLSHHDGNDWCHRVGGNLVASDDRSIIGVGWGRPIDSS
jgi:hypothetical protein